MAVKKVETRSGTRWRLRVYLGRDPETGKREIITRTFKRKKDAEREHNRLNSRKDLGALTAPSKEPLGKYLRRWLTQVGKGRVSARTYSDYVGVVQRYVEHPPEGVSPVGKVRLDRLRPETLQALYSDLQERCGLSARTIRSLHAVVRQALAYAARTGAVGRNVADSVVLPRMKRREVVAMTTEEATAFLDAARSDRYYALWCVQLSVGLRPSEALGLKWPHFDADTGKLYIQRKLTRRGGATGWRLEELKTDRSRRVVALPDFAVHALREHRRGQAAERLLLGEEYQNHEFIFATEFGSPLDGANVYDRNFRGVMAAATLGTWEGAGKARKFKPKYRLYDLRHSAATLLLRAGVHPKVVSEMLGHASVAFTLDVYSASLPDMQGEAAEKMEAMLGSA